jgi:hypothetical protein
MLQQEVVLAAVAKTTGFDALARNVEGMQARYTHRVTGLLQGQHSPEASFIITGIFCCCASRFQLSQKSAACCLP